MCHKVGNALLFRHYSDLFVGPELIDSGRQLLNSFHSASLKVEAGKIGFRLGVREKAMVTYDHARHPVHTVYCTRS